MSLITKFKNYLQQEETGFEKIFKICVFFLNITCGNVFATGRWNRIKIFFGFLPIAGFYFSFRVILKYSHDVDEVNSSLNSIFSAFQVKANCSRINFAIFSGSIFPNR